MIICFAFMCECIKTVQHLFEYFYGSLLVDLLVFPFSTHLHGSCITCVNV